MKRISNRFAIAAAICVLVATTACLAPIHRKDECRSVLKGQGSAPVLLG